MSDLSLSSSNDFEYRILDAFPEPEFSTLAGEAFSDYAESRLLTDVLNDEMLARESFIASDAGAMRIGAFQNGALVGWTFSRPDGTQLHMVNSGVAPAGRRHGIYSRLVQMTLEHAKEKGYVAVLSRHTANNNAVIIAKLKLGFFISGFEYSEVYGPLVRLTFLPGELRRKLYQARSTPIRRLVNYV